MSLTVVLAEDSPPMRDGLVGVLTRFGHRLAAEVGDADSLIAAVREHRSGIVVTDIRMPPDHSDDGGVGYLLKDRVSAVTEFVDAVARVAAGETVVDPEVVRQLLHRQQDPLRRLTPREREVLSLMAEGRANAAIARHLYVTEAAVNKHVSAILQKPDLRVDGEDHRRVLAVLAYLRA